MSQIVHGNGKINPSSSPSVVHGRATPPAISSLKSPPIAVHNNKTSPNTLRSTSQSSPNGSPQRGAHGVLLIPSSQIEYNKNEKLGKGSQGTAYKAKWKSREVVFKKLNVHNSNPSQKREFLRELEVWRNIHHPSSVSLFGAVDDSEKCGYVMEYCHNGNLQEQMKNALVLGPIRMVDIARGISDVLSILHDSGIAHRDIKCANIMLDRDFHPKLGDFGLSRMLNNPQTSATNLTGTPTHMAPEQFVFGAKHNPIQADLYSYGMLLYEMATNQPPFSQFRLDEIAQMLARGERPPIPLELPSGMDGNERRVWWSVVTDCWAQDPLKRPSMGEVAIKLTMLYTTMTQRIHGFHCLEHKAGAHDYFLSYRVASEKRILYKRENLIILYKFSFDVTKKQYFQFLTLCIKRNENLIFLDVKCLPDAEDWQKSFLYGLHHSKIIVPVISSSGLAHFHKAPEENDNVLLEYEHMLSMLAFLKGKVKVFPLFIDDFPRVSTFPDKPHITTGKNIRNTLTGILRLQGRKIKLDTLEEIVSPLLEKLDELDSGVNASMTIHHGAAPSSQEEELPIPVFIQVAGEAQRESSVEAPPSATLHHLRAIIEDQLDDITVEYNFLKPAGPRLAVVTAKQEAIYTVKSVIDQDSNITVQSKAKQENGAKQDQAGGPIKVEHELCKKQLSEADDRFNTIKAEKNTLEIELSRMQKRLQMLERIFAKETEYQKLARSIGCEPSTVTLILDQIPDFGDTRHHDLIQLIYHQITYWNIIEFEDLPVLQAVLNCYRNLIQVYCKDLDILAYILADSALLLYSLYKHSGGNMDELIHVQPLNSKHLTQGSSTSPVSDLFEASSVEGFFKQLQAVVGECFGLLLILVANQLDTLLDATILLEEKERIRFSNLQGKTAYPIILYLQKVLAVLQSNLAHLRLIQQFFSEVFTRINNRLMNAICTRQQLCTNKFGHYLKAVVDAIQAAADEMGSMWVGDVNKYLQNIRQVAAVLLLVDLNSLAEDKIRKVVCPSLNALQLRQLLSKFKPAESGKLVPVPTINAICTRVQEQNADCLLLPDVNVVRPFSIKVLHYLEVEDMLKFTTTPRVVTLVDNITKGIM